MTYAVCGAGAIGGVVAAQLVRAGLDVTLLARGQNYARIRDSGLRLRTPTEDVVVPVNVVSSAHDLEPGPDLVVLLTVKSQDTASLVLELRDRLGAGCPVACLQNGVENERIASRFFENVYATSVMSPNVHLDPGEFEAYSSPVVGVLEHGRYAGGSEEAVAQLAKDLLLAGFESHVVPDVMAVKYGKLLKNLGNAVEVVCGPQARGGPLTVAAQDEGRRCLDAAGIGYEEESRRSSLVTPLEIDGRKRPAGSTWQSIKRGLARTETDFLNGEIAMIGRQFGIVTPVNAELQRLVASVAAHPETLGSFDEHELLASSEVP